jgi:hypothetical protein
VDSNWSLLLAALIGAFAFLLFLAIVLVLSRAIGRRSNGSSPQITIEDGHYKVAGKLISCSQCSSTEFKMQLVLLNTWLMSLLRIDWLDSNATVLTCERCGKLTWFAQGTSKDE